MSVEKKRKLGLFLVVALAACIFTGITLFCLFGMKQRKPVTDPDFSTKKLLVGVDSRKNLSAGGTVVSSHGNTYLLSFDSEEATRNAYEEYKNSANFVDTDAYVYLDRNEGTPDDSQALEQIAGGDKVGTPDTIAMVSTGITGEADKVSVMDDYTESEEGTRLAMLIRKQNPAANLISIQAFNKEGTATSASLYAAIETAVNKGAGTIVLPFSTTNLPGTTAVGAAIKDAVDKGVTVIGAAGDKDIEALYTTPGSDESTLVVGACNDNGKKLRSSNYGQSVDYNVVGGNTAEAAATMAGYVSKNGAVIDNKTVFSTDGKTTGETDNGSAVGSLLDTDVDELSEGVSVSGFTADAELTDSVRDAAKEYAGIDADAAVALPSRLDGQNFAITGSKTGSNVLGLKLNGTESNGTGEISVTPSEIKNNGENSEVTFHVTADTKKGQAEADYTFKTRDTKEDTFITVAPKEEGNNQADNQEEENSSNSIGTSSVEETKPETETSSTSVSTELPEVQTSPASDEGLTETKQDPADPDKEQTGSIMVPSDENSDRLLVQTDDKKNTEKQIQKSDGTIIGQYEDTYLVQYDSAEQATKAREVLANHNVVQTDHAGFALADDTAAGDLNIPVTSDNNPLQNLSEADRTQTKGAMIALIDTGASGNNVRASVSMLGESVYDDNGHGSTMAAYVSEENPNATILSIKALDSNGNGTASSIYAAIKYATEQKVQIINMSLSGAKTEDNAVVEKAIRDAEKAGITVIGAAGNNGKNAENYLPGGIAEATVAGACDTHGDRIQSSNFGATVDYNVVASSTSEAAARLSGILSKDGKITADNRKVFNPGSEDQVSTDDSFIDKNGFHAAAVPTGAQKVGSGNAHVVTYRQHAYYSTYGYGTWDTNAQIIRYNGKDYNGICAQPWNASNAIGASMDLYTIANNDALANRMKKVLYYGYGQRGASQGIQKIDGTLGGQLIITHLAISYLHETNSADPDAGWATQTNAAGRAAAMRYLNLIDHLPSVPDGVELYFARPYGNAQILYFIRVNPDSYGSVSKTSSNSNYTNGDSYYSLAGAVYYLYDANGNWVATLTTDANGNTPKVKLKPGTYTAIEQAASPGYRLDDGRDRDKGPSTLRHTLTVTLGQNAVFNSVEPYYNHGQIHLYKKDAITGYELQGAEFTLYERNSSGGWDNRGLLHSQGSHFWTDVLHETYSNNKYGAEFKIVETKAPGAHRDKAGNIYLAKESDSQFVREFTLSGDVNQVVSEISASNRNTKVHIKITKMDEVHPEIKVSGATLRLYPWNNRAGAFDEGKAITLQETSTGIYECDFLTDETNEGKIRIVEGHLSNGKLVQDKDELPVKYSGHVDQQHMISSAATQETYTWECFNHIEPQHARIVMNKTDLETGDAIEGATFKVYEHDLKAGKWVYYTTMVWNKTTKQYELPAGTDLLGYYDDSSAAYKYYGHYNTGKYVVVEEKAPTGYVTEHPADGFANPDTGVKFKYWDASFDNTETPKEIIKLEDLATPNTPTSVYLQKVDADGNPINGIVFQYGNVNDDSTEYKTATTASMMVDTDADGKADTMMDGIIKIQRIRPGTWQLQETDVSNAQAYDKDHQGVALGDPRGYHLDDTWNKFYVNNDGLLKSGSGTLVRTDKIGNVSVGKDGQKEDGSADTEWGNYLVFRQTNYTEYPLHLEKYAEMEGSLYAITADGYKKKTGETDYAADELHDPLVKKDTYTDITDDSVKAVLESIVHTYNEDGSIKGQQIWTIGQKFPYGMKFSVYEYSESGKNVDENGYKTTPAAVMAYSDKAGMFVDEQTASGDNPKEVKLNYTPDNQGKWMVRETAATAGYIPDSTPKYITLPAVPDRNQYNRLKVVQFINTPNEFSINKIDTKGNKVAGCQFRIWMDPIDGGSDNGEVILQTNQDNDCTLYALRPGTWHYQETSVPKGFTVDNNIYDFTVSADGTIEQKPYKKVTRVNTQQTLLRVLKEDTTEQYLNEFPDGTEFYIYEWDADKGAFSSVPSKKLIYKKQ